MTFDCCGLRLLDGILWTFPTNEPLTIPLWIVRKMRNEVTVSSMR